MHRAHANHRVQAALWTALTLSVLACEDKRETCVPIASEPAALDVVFTAAPAINRGSERPLPTQVRLYQLRALGNMQRATYTQLYRQPADALRDELVGDIEEFTLYPGSRAELAVTLDDEARYLVGLAFVRDPKGTSWRAIAERPAPAAGECATPGAASSHEYHFQLSEGRMTVESTVRAASDSREGDSEGDSEGGRDADVDRRLETPELNAPALPDAVDTPKLPRAPAHPTAPSVPSTPTPRAPASPTITVKPGL